jgi:hypothetical protein
LISSPFDQRATLNNIRDRYEPRTAVTGAYCCWGQQQGVTCFVRSDGSRLAPQQVRSLITAPEPGLALGRHIQADSGPSSLETLALLRRARPAAARRSGCRAGRLNPGRGPGSAGV